jgi:putative component of toxin-antitoxin plasmid stabilization module
VGAGVIELIINGGPAYRCIYIAKYAKTIFCPSFVHQNDEPIVTQWWLRKIG